MTDQTSTTDSVAMPAAPTVHPGMWTFRGGHLPAIPGVRIGSGRGHQFVADTDILGLALALAEHLETKR